MHSVASVSNHTSSQKKIDHSRKPSQQIKVNSTIGTNAKKNNTTKNNKQGISSNNSSLNINYEPSQFQHACDQSSKADSQVESKQNQSRNNIQQRSSVVSISISEKEDKKTSTKQKQIDQGTLATTIQKTDKTINNKFKNTLQSTSINKYLGGTSKSSTLQSSKICRNIKSGNNIETNNNISAFDADINMCYQQISNQFQNNQNENQNQNNKANQGQKLMINDLLGIDNSQIQHLKFNKNFQNEQIDFNQSNKLVYATTSNKEALNNYLNAEQQISQNFEHPHESNYITKTNNSELTPEIIQKQQSSNQQTKSFYQFIVPVAQLNLNLNSIQNSLQSPNIIDNSKPQRESININNNSNIYSNDNFQKPQNYIDQENYDQSKQIYVDESSNYFKNYQDQYLYELQLHKRGQSSNYSNFQIEKSEIIGNQRYNKSQAQGAQPG